MLLITDAKIITGKDNSILKDASIIIKGKIITNILLTRPSPSIVSSADTIIDTEGNTVIPGIINHHAHGVTGGPLFPSGDVPLPNEKVFENLDQHMLEGTTTLLNLDGFATIEEVDNTKKHHPMNLKTATSHTPLNLKAAELADGSGLQEKHKKTSVYHMIKKGSVAIGEIGSGATLGGMGQDYLYIPDAIKERTGIGINVGQARALKEAVLGKYIDRSCFNPMETARIVKNIGLSSKLTAEEAKKLIEETVLPSFETALKGIEEGAVFAKKYHVPTIIHNAAASKKIVLQVAEEFSASVNIIAAHCNHSSLETKEALDHARKLKQCGVAIDICSGDFFRARRLFDSLETTFMFLKERLADVISTDYMGGFHDPILLIIKKAVEEEVISLPEAISMATWNVAKRIPKLAPNRGTLALGKVADIAILDKDDISKVNTVIIDGKVTVEKGEIRKNCEDVLSTRD